MGLGYDYFTLDEALNFLPYAPSKEWLIEQMFNFDSLENKYSGLQIIPAFHSKQKIYCKYNLSSNDEEITWRRGWFNIHGLNDLKYLSSESILFKSENDEMFLRFDDDDYYIFYPTNEIIVPLNELHIRRDELVHFKSHYYNEEHDDSKKVINSESVSKINNEDDKLSIDINEEVLRFRDIYKDDSRVVYELMKKYGKSRKYSDKNTIMLSALAIGIAVFPNRIHSNPKEKDALETYVWERVRKIHKLT